MTMMHRELDSNLKSLSSNLTCNQQYTQYLSPHFSHCWTDAVSVICFCNIKFSVHHCHNCHQQVENDRFFNKGRKFPYLRINLQLRFTHSLLITEISSLSSNKAHLIPHWNRTHRWDLTLLFFSQRSYDILTYLNDVPIASFVWRCRFDFLTLVEESITINSMHCFSNCFLKATK